MSKPFILSRLLNKKYSLHSGIWHCLPPNYSDPYSLSYNSLHAHPFLRTNDGSFEVLAQFARGNRTLDIGCGDGYLESLEPTIVGLEFSLNALKKARRNGAKHLVLADAHRLPFKNKSFDLTICTGSFEHFARPQQALNEMARVSYTQVNIVHRPYPIPFANMFRQILLKLHHIPDQPYDHPMSLNQLHKLYTQTNLHIIYEGVWTLPYSLEFISPLIPKTWYLPSCHFIISRS